MKRKVSREEIIDIGEWRTTGKGQSFFHRVRKLSFSSHIQAFSFGGNTFVVMVVFWVLLFFYCEFLLYQGMNLPNNLTQAEVSVNCLDSVPKDSDAKYWIIVSDPQLTAEYSYAIEYGPILPLIEYYW